MNLNPLNETLGSAAFGRIVSPMDPRIIGYAIAAFVSISVTSSIMTAADLLADFQPAGVASAYGVVSRVQSRPAWWNWVRASWSTPLPEACGIFGFPSRSGLLAIDPRSSGPMGSPPTIPTSAIHFSATSVWCSGRTNACGHCIRTATPAR